jgi:hypothetical protein
MAFTLFRENLTADSIKTAILQAGVPPQALASLPPFDPNQLTSVGGSLSQSFAQLPPALRGPVQEGFYQAFSLAIANSVWLGVLAAGVSFFAVLALKEQPLRAHFHADQAARAGIRTAGSGQAPEAAE